MHNLSRMKKQSLFIYSLGSLCLLLTSCGITKKYEDPTVETTELYRESTAYQDSLRSLAQVPWKDFFTDTLLKQHIEEGLANNYNMLIAVERLQIAETMLKQSKQAFLPSVQANAGVSRSRLAYTQGFGFVQDVTQYDLGVSASWEIDIWGKLNSAKKAQLAALLQTEASQKAVQSALIANIASQYYRLIALDEQLRIVKETAGNRKSYAQTMQKLKASNVVNGAAVVQSEANQYEAELVIPDIEQQIRETENALSVLLARNPGSIQRSSFETFTNESIPDLTIGVPSDVLMNRPDVMEAVLAYRAAFEMTNVARTRFYPQFTITGGGGFSSFDFSDLFTENIGLFGNIGGGLLQPIFNRGQNKANLKVAESEAQIAMYTFKDRLQVAGQEVSDALFAFEKAQEKTEKRGLQLDALTKSVDYTKKLLSYNSQTNYTDVLTSEQSLLSAQLGGVNDFLAREIALIQLYKALGGGWEE